MKLYHYLAGAVMMLCMATPALAGAPFNVDDPGTTEMHRYTLDLDYLSSQTRGSESQSMPSVGIAYGATNNVELSIGVAAASIRNSGSSRVTGFGDTTVGVKWRFQEETKSSPQIGVTYGLKIPTAGVSRGLGNGKYDHAFGLSSAKSFGRYTALACAAYNLTGDHEASDNWFYGGAVTFQVTERTSIGAQLYGASPGAPGARTEMAYGVGFSRIYAPDQTFMLQIGKSDRGYSDLNVYAGVELTLGKGVHKDAPDAK